MSTKKYVYWGGINSGKYDLMLNCQKNSVEYAVFNEIYINHTVPTRNGNDISLEVKEYYVDKNNKFGEYNYNIQRNTVNDIMYDVIEVDPQIIVNGKGLLLNKGGFWKHQERRKNTYGDLYDAFKSIKHLINDIPILVATLRIFDRKHVINDIISLENTTHVIPFREIKDPTSLIPKINMYQSRRYGGRSFFELYEQEKETAFQYLDKFVSEQRKLEDILIKNNIKVEYFDMNECEYSLFELKDYDKEYLTMPVWDFSDPEIKRRYDMAYSIGEEYIKNRNLINTKLTFQCIDNI